MSGRWTAAEVAALRALYPDHRTAWVAAKLGRSVSSVAFKACELRLRKLDSRPSHPRSLEGASAALRREVAEAKAEWGTAPPYEGWRR